MHPVQSTEFVKWRDWITETRPKLTSERQKDQLCSPKGLSAVHFKSYLAFFKMSVARRWLGVNHCTGFQFLGQVQDKAEEIESKGAAGTSELGRDKERGI